ncbi:MAG: glycogen/starch synthase, partial [Gammaproteobacteria bacterium]|nr:glycogen/starch synthase [Gammaproteobacteria bacterium]
MSSVLFLASENGALPGGKVGGVGDVVRDLPKALASEGWRVRVATPSYGVLHQLTGATRSSSVAVPFRGAQHEVEVWRLAS